MKKNRLIIFFLLIVAALNLSSQERGPDPFQERNPTNRYFDFEIGQEPFFEAETQDALNDSSNPFDLSGLLLDSLISEDYYDDQYNIFYKQYDEYDRIGKLKSRTYVDFREGVISSTSRYDYAINNDSSVYEVIYTPHFGYKTLRRVLKFNNQEEEILYKYSLFGWDDATDSPIYLWKKDTKDLSIFNANGDIISNQHFNWQQSEDWNPETDQGKWILEGYTNITYYDDGTIQASTSYRSSTDGVSYPYRMTSYLYEENKETTINSEYFKDID
jgi:hypothetical protein